MTMIRDTMSKKKVGRQGRIFMEPDSDKHLTHLDEAGTIHMVDVTAPPPAILIEASRAASILVLHF